MDATPDAPMSDATPTRTYVLRVWIPDRPGALGQVASRIGAVRGDVVEIGILERGGGWAIDELLVRIPSADVVDLLLQQVQEVDGVSVESIRPVTSERDDPGLAALSLAAELAAACPTERLARLVAGLKRTMEADWVVALSGRAALACSGDPPDAQWLGAFVDGSRHLPAGGSGPGDVAWASLDAAGVTVVAGRAERPFHERERARLDLLGRVAASLLAG
jgi:hypothetical protein